MSSTGKRARYRLEWFGLVLATRLVPLFSRKACFYLAQFLGAVIFVLDRHGRKVALSNLEVAFGSELSSGARKRIARESFQHFARTMLDLLWSPRLTPENYSRYVEFENFEEIARATGPERNFIMACYHYSNFEWLSIAGGYAGIIGTIISQEFKNELLTPIFKAIREGPGHEFVPRDRGLVRLYKAVRRKRTAALLADLTIPPGWGAVAIDCFGLKTSVTSAHAWLHERTGVPIIPAHCQPLPQGRYRVVFHPQIRSEPGMTHQQIAQACWDSFEPWVRKDPAPWLWMYKHWRYRPVNAERPYPFYAHILEKFDELLEEQRAARSAGA
jgi:Kdo2-lipid IVA lauroyltransferase/acyltransferase